MAVPEEDKRNETSSHWDKSWVFFLALLCVLSLAGLGSWGRLRMLEDDNAKLERKFEAQVKVHKEQETQLRSRLRNKNRLVGNLRQEIAVARDHFEQLNTSLKYASSHFSNVLQDVGDGPSQFLSECSGVTLPSGFAFAPKDELIFPYDVSSNTTALHTLLKSSDSLAPLANVVLQAEEARLFDRPTFPWSQWTWLQALLDQGSDLRGNFTDWGIGAGGSTMFLAGIARQRGASVAGFDAWEGAQNATKHQQLFAQSAKQFGLSVPNDVELFDLSMENLAWPEAGLNEQLAFTHIDSDDYHTTLGILEVVYGTTLEGGIFAVDNFFHPSGGSKKAVEDFFRKHTPGKLPVIYPVFPGFSVLIFKGRFATGADRLNALDGNYYSFKYVKGQPELFNSVDGSVSHLANVHRRIKEDPKANQTQVCWLGLTLQNARNLRDFIQSSDENAEDFETADIFRFMADNAQLVGTRVA